MPVPSLQQKALLNTQMRAVAKTMGAPAGMPVQSILAALVRHGGMYTLLDRDMMTARMSAFTKPVHDTDQADGKIGAVAAPATTAPRLDASEAAASLQSSAVSFFYKLLDGPGYDVHSELMAYISEPGKGNGVAYDEGEQPSDHIPAAFTFVGQFIDHDLTFNGMNLTADESTNEVRDDASPVIDLDSVYGPRTPPVGITTQDFYQHVFDEQGRFLHRIVLNAEGLRCGYDVLRYPNPDPKADPYPDPANPPSKLAYIFDPRNDENQIILQIHILIQRFHNAIIKSGVLAKDLAGHDTATIVRRVRQEVVASWQSVILNEYLPYIIRPKVLEYVLEQIHIKATNPNDLKKQYGDLKHKPYKDLTDGSNVVRMPHEFAIGFRFGHSQLRPVYLLNKKNVVLLFRDARNSFKVTIEGQPVQVCGRDDLRGSRELKCDHVIDWDVFYPKDKTPETQSMLIDHLVTARVFNLPESTIPDDIKYIGNLPHRNLIRGSQIGVASGEELADFYKIERVPPDTILGPGAAGTAAKRLFKLDPKPNDRKTDDPDDFHFKTPLWYYILKEAEVQSKGDALGELGSRLVAEVLAGALYYGNAYPYNDDWVPVAITPSTPPLAGKANNIIKLRDIIEFVNKWQPD